MVLTKKRTSAARRSALKGTRSRPAEGAVGRGAGAHPATGTTQQRRRTQRAYAGDEAAAAAFSSKSGPLPLAFEADVEGLERGGGLAVLCLEHELNLQKAVAV